MKRTVESDDDLITATPHKSNPQQKVLKKKLAEKKKPLEKPKVVNKPDKPKETKLANKPKETKLADKPKETKLADKPKDSNLTDKPKDSMKKPQVTYQATDQENAESNIPDTWKQKYLNAQELIQKLESVGIAEARTRFDEFEKATEKRYSRIIR
jgi:hypothetical protein